MIKKTIALLLAAALMLGAACAEPASEGGAFAVLGRDDGADPRLTALEDLGIDEKERQKLLTWSPVVRNRLTFMRLLHTMELE